MDFVASEHRYIVHFRNIYQMPVNAERQHRTDIPFFLGISP